MKKGCIVLLAVTSVACGGVGTSEPVCNPACTAGQTCKAGTDGATSCQAVTTTCNPTCGTGYACQNGTCTATNPTTCTPACSKGYVCQNGTCTQANTGNLSCREILDCIDKCPDDACANDCPAKGTSDGQKEFAEFWNCLQSTGCSQTNSCSTQCAQPIAACTRGGTTSGISGSRD